MTGYTSIVKAYVPDHQSGNRINFDSFLPVLYVIHDGERIKKANNYFVTDRSDPGSGPNYAWDASYVSKSPFNSEECFLQNNVSKSHYAKDVEQHGLDQSSNVKTTFMEFDLEPPTLNISASFFYDPTLYGSADRVSPHLQQKALWIWSNDTYNYTYLSTFGTCQPDGGNYQWGFSFIQLFIMNIMLLIWTLGILIMWYRAQSTMQKRGRVSVAGVHKAVVELAETMHKELDAEDFDLSLSTEAQIKQRTAAAKGGSIAYDAPLVDEKVPDASFTKWLKREKWWLIVTFVFIFATSVLMIIRPLSRIPRSIYRVHSNTFGPNRVTSTMSQSSTSENTTSTVPPPLTHMLETCIYVSSASRSAEWYSRIFNITPDFVNDRMASFPIPPTTLLLFTLGYTSADSDVPNRGRIAGHGPTPEVLNILSKSASSTLDPKSQALKQHFCFAVPNAEDVKKWEQHLSSEGVKILSTMDWERGGRSVYFEDLDGNVGEVASRGLWKHW
ncbi:uncharacterized protein N0V89_002022 [Didymosphaeria variabile]|uniref:VOC domain-containing protein n=1 Tax=Didymosphaeria variabile TaxID=1932322 RepID=A0A9W8XQX5_9PLEO|nr:uncharacterized protein N0V89_002022 [Didymosphaeria variabile]KAJ4357447.1 hypothetical protein N0V89_002022 [Didymosphaeria variabile]